MIKKIVTYKDFNGDEHTDEFLFHLSKAEVAELQLKSGGLKEHVEYLEAINNYNEIVTFFTEIILKAYGIKSADGKNFLKTKEVKESFEYSNAYAELFMMLIEDTESGAEFIKGVVGLETSEIAEASQKATQPARLIEMPTKEKDNIITDIRKHEEAIGDSDYQEWLREKYKNIPKE